MNQEWSHDERRRAELQRRCEDAREQLREIRGRMDEIKQEVADEVDRRWTSMWRTDEMFDLKLNARLTGHEEYRSLVDQTRELEKVETALAEELDRTGQGDPAG